MAQGIKFPDFIIVGAMKCGTTVLWHNLNKHPDITMCKNIEDPKPASTEIRFWNNGQPYYAWEKGVDWYRNLFSGNICGEKCANYIEQAKTIKRMSEYIPNVKLILNIRNPVDRAYSEYQMQNKRVVERFSMILSRQVGYLERGEYWKQIKNNVLPFFPKENLYIIVQESMKNDTNKELNKLYNFLGVNTYNLNVKRTTPENATNRNLDLYKDGLDKNYKVWNTNYNPMDQETKKLLTEYYKEHNNKLFDFLGYNIKEWQKI